MAILWAIRDGDLRCVKEQMKQCEILPYSNCQLLESALMHRQRRIALFFIEKGCNTRPKCCKSRGSRLLRLAIRNRDFEIVKIFLNNENLKESIHRDGHGLLEKAADTRNREIINTIIDELIEANGDDYLERLGLTPLHVACLRGDVSQVLTLLESKSEVNARAVSPSRSSLSCESHGTKAQKLMGKWLEHTPLHFAVEQGNTEIVLILLLHEADIHAENYEGLSPKLIAFKESNRIVLDLVLLAEEKYYKYSKPINYKEFNCTKMENIPGKGEVTVPDCNTLYFALTNQLNRVTELLVRQGADVNAKNSLGLTLLHKAVLDEREGTLKMLLQLGADFSVKSNSDNTALELAVGQEFLEGIVILSKYYMNRDDLTPLASEGKPNVDVNEEKFKRFCSKYLQNIDMQYKLGGTMLMEAVKKGNFKRIETLIQLGANVNLKTGKDKTTALHLATKSKQPEIMELLLKNGARVDARDGNGETALHSLCYEQCGNRLLGTYDNLHMEMLALSDHVQVRYRQKLVAYDVYFYKVPGKHTIIPFHTLIDLLSRYGADINARELRGYSPLFIACAYGSLNFITALLDRGADVNAEDNQGRCLSSYLLPQSPVDAILLTHMRKLDALKFPVMRRKEYRDWESSYCFIKFDNECEKELERMKQFNLVDGTTLYDVLFMDPDEVLRLIENNSLMNIKSDDFYVEFPLYCEFVRLQYMKGIDLQLQYLIQDIFIQNRLPDLCTDVILKHLNDNT